MAERSQYARGRGARPATTLVEKQGHAAVCIRKLQLAFPALVDGMDGATDQPLRCVAEPSFG